MLDGAVGALEVVVEDEVLVARAPGRRCTAARWRRGRSRRPVVERASQPRPTSTWVRFGAALERETLPPLASVTPMMLVLPEVVLVRSLGAALPPRRGVRRRTPRRERCGADAGRRWPGAAVGSDVDAEVLRDAAQARGVALADGAELPLGAVAVQLAEDHRGLGRGVLGEVVAGELGAAGLVDDADERVADLAEGLLAVLGVVDRDREDDLVDVGRDAGEVDLDLLVVALALTGEVVTGVLDRAVRGSSGC